MTLANGDRKVVDVPALEKLEVSAVPAKDPTTAAAQTPAVTELPTRQQAPQPPAQVVDGPRVQARTYVTFGVAGAGLLAGSIFGALSLAKTSDIKAACSGTRCPTSSAGDISGATATAWVSDIGLGVGVAAAALGAYFLVSDLSTNKPSAAARITPTVSFGSRTGSLGLLGNF